MMKNVKSPRVTQSLYPGEYWAAPSLASAPLVTCPCGSLIAVLGLECGVGGQWRQSPVTTMYMYIIHSFDK